MIIFDKVVEDLKSYMKKSKYDPVVMKLEKGNQFPRVIVKKASDREIGKSTLRMDVHSHITFEIDIYAKVVGNISEVTIAEELEDLIKQYMGDKLGFTRTFDQPTPNVDTSVYRITMRYEGNINERRNTFY